MIRIIEINWFHWNFHDICGNWPAGATLPAVSGNLINEDEAKMRWTYWCRIAARRIDPRSRSCRYTSDPWAGKTILAGSCCRSGIPRCRKCRRKRRRPSSMTSSSTPATWRRPTTSTPLSFSQRLYNQNNKLSRNLHFISFELNFYRQFYSTGPQRILQNYI